MLLAKRIFLLIGVCLGIAIGAMAFSAINLTLSAIKQDLHTTVAAIQWMMNIFGIAICSTLVVFGRLADMYGRKRLYLIGISLLTISVLGSGLAQSAGWIIFFQALLGLAGAILIPVSQTLISHAFPENQRSKAIGIWAAVIGIAMAIGPLLSGIIISIWHWRWVFLINVPIAILSFILVAILATESRSHEKEVGLDLIGAILLAITIGTFVLALLQIDSWPLPFIIVFFVISFCSGIILFWVEKNIAKSPIIREDLLTHRGFLSASFANFCLVFFVWAIFFLLPLYLQTILQYSALQAGLIMLLVTIPLSIFSFGSGLLYKKIGAKLLIMIGFICLVLSAFLQMHFTMATPLIHIALAALAFGLGWGLSWSATTTAAISTLPTSQGGIASGTFATIQEIGGTMGLAITGSVVRTYADFLTGYQRGMWILIIISLLGFITILFLPNPER